MGIVVAQDPDPASLAEGMKRLDEQQSWPLILPIWEFQKARGTLLWGPYNKDPTI